MVRRCRIVRGVAWLAGQPVSMELVGACQEADRPVQLRPRCALAWVIVDILRTATVGISIVSNADAVAPSAGSGTPQNVRPWSYEGNAAGSTLQTPPPRPGLMATTRSPIGP